MNLTVRLWAMMMLIALSACTAPEVKQSRTTVPEAPKKAGPVERESLPLSGETPPLTKTKAGKTLRLVRMMDGGACKNDLEGVQGIFLLYADSEDIERIKAEQGAQVFAEFEKKIEAFSSVALQQAVNNTHFALDPFALDATDAQLKVARQLLAQFDRAIAHPIKQFQQDTTLTIDVTPFFNSLVFYTEGCDATHLHQDVND
jgi:hypothetical protein